MKEVLKKAIFILGMVVIFASSFLCLLLNIILFIYAIYKKIKTSNKKINLCILLYTLQLVAYCGDLIGESYFLSQFTINGSNQLFELIGFNCLGIAATYILFKNIKGNDNK